MESYLVVPKGHGAGKLMKLARFQKADLERLLEDASLRSAIVSEPRGNGKSTFAAGIGLWALHDDEFSPSVPVVATTVQQAIRTIFNTCRRMNDASPELADRTITYTAIGATRLFVPWNNGELMPLPADPDGLQGLDPSLAIIDEVGFVSQDLFDAMVLASGKRPRSLVLGIGTPNLERSGAMWELREKVRAGVHLPGFRYIEHAAPEGCDLRDRDAWRTANPAVGAGFKAIDAMEMAVAVSPEASFRVFQLGQWVDAAPCWLPDGAWPKLADPFELVDGALTWVGVDIGLKLDTSAVVAAQFRPDGRLHVSSRVWDPTHGAVFDASHVQAHLRGLVARFDVREILYDPRLFELAAIALADEGLPMLEFPQSVERMSPACANAFELIVSGRVTHDGDPVLTAHVLSAQQRPNDRGWTLSKSRSKRHIDACIALVLAVWRASQPSPIETEPTITWL